MGILEGKKLLVTGVLMDSSIAFHVAKIAQEEGATGRAHLVRAHDEDHPDDRQPAPRDARGASSSTSTDAEHLDSLAERLREHVDGLDGVLHSIGFAPQGAFNFMEGTWEDVATALHASAYSLKSLAAAALPLMDGRRQRRRAHLRRQVRLAGLRLDGRGQGGLRVDQPLPRP